MSEFDISDKELKSLLRTEGMEEPSMGFNQAVLSKIKALEKTSTKPVTAPKWLLILLGFLFVAPSLYFIFSGQSSATDSNQLNFTVPSVDPGSSSKFLLIGAFAILAIGVTLLLERIFKLHSTERSR